MLLEDLQWFDGGSDSVLEVLVEAVVGTRTLLLANFRPEYHAGWMQRSDYQQVGAFKTGAGAGGYPQQRTQWLLKPTRSVEAASQACEAARLQQEAEAQR